MKVSIILTTSNHCEDYLKPCLESLIANSDMEQIEIIVVSNGSKDGTRWYLKNMPVTLVWFNSSIGYTKAVNEGMKKATGDYILLLNDDTVVTGSNWLEILEKPFLENPKTGITGPVKFTWDCGGLQRTALAFWCVMFRRSLVDEIGYLDEIFNPGMGEDGDFCIKAELIGYDLVQVPTDSARKFGTGIVDEYFPIYHKGNGTFASDENAKNEIIKVNNQILVDKYDNRLESIYACCLEHECDINTLFPILRKYASQCEHITEFGVRGVFSTYAFLASRPITMRSYDIETSANINEALEVAVENTIDFQFQEEDVLGANIEKTDLLFIDTLHVYNQLKQELALHADKVRKYILIHDTTTWGEKDEIEQAGEGVGLRIAINEFLDGHLEWRVKETIEESNGLTILERIPEYSIIIPTHNRLESLQKCLTSVLIHTDLTDKEIIVVPNGNEDTTLKYLDTMRKKVKILNIPGKVGQITPVNRGIELARGKFIVLLDDDCMLLEQPQDAWIEVLHQPHMNESVGISGVFAADYPGLGLAMHNGCVMFRKQVWVEVQGFDDAFGFGYLYDTDFSLRVTEAGYSIIAVGLGGGFPIYHPESPVTSVTKQDKVSLIRKNREILYRRHGMKPKYSVVIPSYGHLEDCLKPCLESIKQNTDLSNVEIIVVSNGSTKETADYVDNLGHPFKLVWFGDKIGFTKATNEGIKVAQGDYVVLLNNDTKILDMGGPVNSWLEMLVAPFLDDAEVGISGPLMLHDDYADHEVIIFFCCMIRQDMFEKVGMLDECFSPGGGEDIDFCVRLVQAGFKQAVVPHPDVRLDQCSDGEVTNVGSFPIYHMGEATFSKEEWPDYGNRIIKENGTKNMLRYNKHIKLNLGSGGVEIPGYLSVDLYDNRASILMDVFNLDTILPENSVEELMASHLFEHVNPYKSVELLQKWCKILKPGGKLIMELPNILELCQDFVNGTKAERYGILNCVYGSVNTKDSEDPSAITSPHLWGWYPEIMVDHLVWAGFTDIKILPEQIPHPHKNFRVEATKPMPIIVKEKNEVLDTASVL